MAIHKEMGIMDIAQAMAQAYVLRMRDAYGNCPTWEQMQMAFVIGFFAAMDATEDAIRERS